MAGKTRQQQNTNQGGTATTPRRSTRAAPAVAASTTQVFTPSETTRGYSAMAAHFRPLIEPPSWAILEYLATGATPTSGELVAAFQDLKFDREAISGALRAMGGGQGGRGWIESEGKGTGTHYRISEAGKTAWGIVRNCRDDLGNLRK